MWHAYSFICANFNVTQVEGPISLSVINIHVYIIHVIFNNNLELHNIINRDLRSLPLIIGRYDFQKCSLKNGHNLFNKHSLFCSINKLYMNTNCEQFHPNDISS